MTKILIVDDNPDIVFSIRKGLESLNHNYTVTGAIGGRECIEVLKKQKPDLVLLDIMMPDIDGLEVLKIIRKNNKKLTVAFLSAKEQSMSDEMIQLGVKDYIVKPVSIKELDRRIQNILKNGTN